MSHLLPGRLLAILSAALLFSACASYASEVRSGSCHYQLAEVVAESGETSVYELHVDDAAAPRVQIVTSGERDRPDFGFDLVELDVNRANACGLRPYSGLLVQMVRKDSAAEQAGLAAGDVVYTMAGQEIYYQKAYIEAAAGLQPEQEVAFEIGKKQTPGERRTLKLRATMAPRKFREYESVPLLLREKNNRRPYAGVVLAAIPGELSKEIFGDARHAVVISKVSVGSPAYHAGLRGGDLLHSVDGGPVPSLDELADLIQKRGRAGQKLRLEVSRGTKDAHQGEVQLADYSGRRRFRFPLVLHSTVDCRRTDWGLGPWNIVAGYNNRYRVTDEREPDSKGGFSALVGLIRCRWTGDRTSWRLLWFISF